jgi:oligoendopeptidase F
MSSVPERSEVDDEYKWDVGSVFESVDEWEAAFEGVEARLDDLAVYEGRVTADGDTLLEFLEFRDEVAADLERVAVWARLRKDEDTRDQTYQALVNRVNSLASRYSSAVSFFEPAVQSLDSDELDRMVAETPGLEVYDHYLDDIHRLKPHTRSAEVENVLAELSEVTGASGDVYSMLLNADLSFPSVADSDGDEVEITLNNFTTLLRQSDRTLRRRAHEAVYETFAEYSNTITTAYRNSVTTDVKLARVRNYDTAREASLNGPNVPVEVYDTLVETVRDNLGPLHRHTQLKRRHLGVDDLQMWDLYVPLADGDPPEVTWPEAKEYVTEAVAPLGEEYQRRLAEGLESQWVDVYENRGKRSGAYSGGAYDTQPFVLMNFQRDPESLFTTAHELGHSMHSLLTSEHQPYVYADYEIFTAEVASTVNETLLTRHLLDTVEDDRFRRFVLDQYLERFRSTLFRQTLFADFEHQAHAIVEDDGALTADRLDDIYRELKTEFYEPAVVDDHVEREWMRIPHFYSAYYVYQYATGISAAVSLARGILEEGEPAAERYLEFLRKGGRKYPIDLLETAGVDVRSADPVEDAIEVYDDYLDEIAALL